MARILAHRPFELDLGEFAPDELQGVIATLKPVGVAAFQRYQTQAVQEDNYVQAVIDLTAAHIVGIDGLTIEQEDGTESEFKAIREDHLLSLGLGVLTYIANKLIERVTLPAFAAKN